MRSIIQPLSTLVTAKNTLHWWLCLAMPSHPPSPCPHPHSSQYFMETKSRYFKNTFLVWTFTSSNNMSQGEMRQTGEGQRRFLHNHSLRQRRGTVRVWIEIKITVKFKDFWGNNWHLPPPLPFQTILHHDVVRTPQKGTSKPLFLHELSTPQTKCVKVRYNRWVRGREGSCTVKGGLQ